MMFFGIDLSRREDGGGPRSSGGVVHPSRPVSVRDMPCDRPSPRLGNFDAVLLSFDADPSWPRRGAARPEAEPLPSTDLTGTCGSSKLQPICLPAKHFHCEDSSNRSRDSRRIARNFHQDPMMQSASIDTPPQFTPIWLRARTLIGLLLLGSLIVQSPASAKTRHARKETSEDWASSQIQLGKTVNFNGRCGTAILDSHLLDQESDASWKNECRTIRASFLVDVLTRAEVPGRPKFRDVELVGARIIGDIGLQNTKIKQAVVIQSSRVEGDIDLTAAHLEGAFAISDSRVTGSFIGSYLDAGAFLALVDSDFGQSVLLNSAKIFTVHNYASAIIWM